MTLFIICWRICPFSADSKMFVSSENKTVFVALIFIGRSFMYNKNNIGPKVELLGTSCLKSFIGETCFP
jgi:hypothetical protein